MPFNGSGTYNPPDPPVFPAVSGTTISSAYFNSTVTDIAGALSICMTVDGQSDVQANLPMDGFKFVNIGDGSAATDSCSYGQLQAETTRATGAETTLQTNITEGDATTLTSANAYTDSKTPAASEVTVGVSRFATLSELQSFGSTALGINPVELGNARAVAASLATPVSNALFVTPKSLADFVAATLGNPMSLNLFGFIIKVGSLSSSNGTGSVTFAAPFPTAVISGGFSSTAVDGGADINPSMTLSTTAFTMQNNINAAQTIYWWAVGH